MDAAWLSTTSSAVLMVAVSAAGIYLALLLLTRTAGGRPLDPGLLDDVRSRR